mgnify:CR=1 FL=1
MFIYFPTPTSSGPTADDVRNADALGDAEKRRNEILTERLDLERQLYKFESDITKQISKQSKRIITQSHILRSGAKLQKIRLDGMISADDRLIVLKVTH